MIGRIEQLEISVLNAEAGGDLRVAEVLKRGPWRLFLLLLLAVSSLAAYLFLDPILDQSIMNQVDSTLDSPWQTAIKSLGKGWAPIWLLLVLAWLRRRPHLLAAGMLAMLLVGATVIPTKFLVGRLRPTMTHGEVAERRARGKSISYSFPSGDTATAFAAAGVIAVAFSGGWRVLPYLAAGIVGALRVIGLRHYPSDVLAGAVVGLAAAWCAMVIVARLAQRAPPDWCRCPSWLFWTLWGLAAALVVSEVVSGDTRFTAFLQGFGPCLVVALLLTRGRTWLRWCSGAGLGRPASEHRRRVWSLVMVMVLAALVILPCLSWMTLYDRDEGYYVGSAWEMLQRRDFVVPHFSGEPWLEKPPLTYWLMAGSMAAFGKTEFAARLPSALAAICALGLTFHLARRLYSIRAGVVAAAMLGTSLMFGTVARLALLDGVLLCCVLLAMIGFHEFLNDRRRRGLFMFYLGCGLGGLAKGPLGIALPVLAMIGYVIWMRDWRLPLRMRPLVGALIVLAVVSVWAMPASWLTDGEYFYELVWRRTIQPVFSPLQGHGGGNPIEYIALLPAYIPALFFGFMPWSLLLLWAVWRKERRRAVLRRRRDPRIALLGGWILAQLTAFSFVATKLPHHVLPIVPSLAILGGALFDHFLRRGESPRFRWSPRERKVFAAVLGVFAVGLAVTPLAVGFTTEAAWFLPPAAALGVVAVVVPGLVRKGRLDHAFLGVVAALVMSFALVWQVSGPALDDAKSSRRVAQFLKQHYGRELADIRIGRCKYKEVSVVFYADRPIEYFSDVQDFYADDSPGTLIVPEERLVKAIGDGFDMPHRVLWRRRAWIPEKAEWVNLLVITNENVETVDELTVAASRKAGRIAVADSPTL